MVVLLLGSEEEPRVGAAVAGSLARLGITHVSLLRDRDHLAVVLEGWAFDPGALSLDELAGLLGGGPSARVLNRVATVSVGEA